ncbi:MAG: Ig-like domain-containing protein [Bacteroidales bacterium]|jgi:hypothetical protein|nr:Ig-like domain-containing protein [Bacteroidales bacterium]
MKKILIIFVFLHFTLNQYSQIIIDHSTAMLADIPVEWINEAKSKLHIAYEHTSHGSQIIDGMTGLYKWKGSIYSWNDGGSDGALDIDDHGITGSSDLGSPDWTSWAASTRTYLDNDENNNINVVMWSWCGQVSDATESNINTYLALMSDLEEDYPDVKFVYMTGHLDGTGINGNLNQRNEQIRDYCRRNGKILYDFADIESYNPDGDYFLNKAANDNCDYDSDGNGSRDRNWAIEWQNSHTLNIDWYDCDPSHSQPLNGNLKAYAAWWLWARLAGWTGTSGSVTVTGITVSGSGGSSSINSYQGTLQMNASIVPANADNKSVKWSVFPGSGKAIINSSGLLTAIANGTVTVRADANDGSGVYGTLVVTISGQEVPVENITITTSTGSNVIPDLPGTLQLSARITPQAASSKSIDWTVENLTGKAVISSSGLVTAIDEGVVKVIAEATDGSGVKSSIDIRIGNYEPLVLFIRSNELRVALPEGDHTRCRLSLYNLNGSLLAARDIIDNYPAFDIGLYPSGLYIVTLSDGVILKVGKIFIP